MILLLSISITILYIFCRMPDSEEGSVTSIDLSLIEGVRRKNTIKINITSMRGVRSGR